ncbi:hypothetical protein [Neorhodopirellula pilleata]|uniref:Double zinc ribbon n=1 Tax=Neorhodopirellula pilleata TaxID=2714738 RepID=A0A5C5ZXH6_9BACT|nr:hypothetical protein [Neorhodopirellula pilleata]TWT91850.1 hypothetical protein Pla100_48880 [Neorhodopirellula pilleata]
MSNAPIVANSNVQIHCPRCDSPLEAGDLRCSICGQAAPDLKNSTSSHVSVKLLRCQGCGAAITYDPDLQAPACSFCGDVLEVETNDDPMEQTQWYLPMTVSANEARAALKTWLGTRGWFQPSDLSSASKLTEIKPLWWVAWVCDAEALVSWTADSNAGAGRSAWAPHSGQTPIRFASLLVSGSRGLTQKESDAITPGFKLETAMTSPSGGGEHPTLERFDVSRSQARQQIASAINSTAAARVEHEFVPGTRFRHVHVSIVLRQLITQRYAFPAYVLAYRYRNELYRVVICGQDARYIIGSSPFSYAKLFLVIGGVTMILLLGLLLMSSIS